MISILEYNNNHFEELLDYCKKEVNEKDPAASNMWNENWEEDCSTLPYLLKNTGRFSDTKGKFFLLTNDKKIIGCSGVYKSDFSNNVSLLGVRSWITKEYRKKQYVREFFLPIQKKWAIENNSLLLALSFNEYNKNLIKMFTLGQKVYTRNENHIFFYNFNILEYPVIIQGVPQWVIYEKLSNWDYNWQELR